jgi:tRNA (cytidine/uridine-2'-O-)-methyltransferase
MFFISTHGEKNFFDAEYELGDYLIFGRESAGLPKEFYEKYMDDMWQIPMTGEFSRSLNLANAASILLYEALRQHK